MTLIERAGGGIGDLCGVQLRRLVLIGGLRAARRISLLALGGLARFIVAEMANIALDTSGTWPLLIAGTQQGRLVSACARSPRQAGETYEIACHVLWAAR